LAVIRWHAPDPESITQTRPAWPHSFGPLAKRWAREDIAFHHRTYRHRFPFKIGNRSCGGLIDIVRLLLEQGASARPICGPATRAQALVRLIAELSADVF
jgi:hypothetical protein